MTHSGSRLAELRRKMRSRSGPAGARCLQLSHAFPRNRGCRAGGCDCLSCEMHFLACRARAASQERSGRPHPALPISPPAGFASHTRPKPNTYWKVWVSRILISRVTLALTQEMLGIDHDAEFPRALSNCRATPPASCPTSPWPDASPRDLARDANRGMSHPAAPVGVNLSARASETRLWPSPVRRVVPHSSHTEFCADGITPASMHDRGGCGLERV
jgi:hypothetical protein